MRKKTAACKAPLARHTRIAAKTALPTKRQLRAAMALYAPPPTRHVTVEETLATEQQPEAGE